MFFQKMLKIYLIIVGLHLVIFGVSGRRSKQENNHTEISLLDKQHDYKINFERAETFRYDKHYIKFLHMVTFKYNRTSPLVNVTVEYKVDIGNELELIVQASNEYRLFPIRFQMNFCQAISNNIAGAGDVYKCGNFTGCPVLKGKTYKICNWGPNPDKFPPFIPNGQYMVELQASYRSIELFVTRVYATVYRPISIPQK